MDRSGLSMLDAVVQALQQQQQQLTLPEPPHVSHRHIPRAIRHKEHIQDVSNLNTKIAVILTRAVGTMPTAYVFTALSLIGLLGLLGYLPAGVFLFCTWLSQMFLQLVFLPILSVGQSVLSKHQELQSEEQYKSTMQTYHDAETILTRLDSQDSKILELEQHILAILQAVDTPTASRKSIKAGGTQ